MKLVASWSGGKDSCLACFKAMQPGNEILFLYNTIADDVERVRFHGLQKELIELQAQAMEIPLVQIKTNKDQYEQDYRNGLKHALQETNANGMIFGDIHLQHCLAWAQKMTKEQNLTLLEPLWKDEPIDILKEFVKQGFVAYIVSCNMEQNEEEFVGRFIDEEFIKEIETKDIDPCGENGEFHTFVVDGPIFKKRIEITKAEKVYKKPFYFLDIQEYKLVEKN